LTGLDCGGENCPVEVVKTVFAGDVLRRFAPNWLRVERSMSANLTSSKTSPLLGVGICKRLTTVSLRVDMPCAMARIWSAASFDETRPESVVTPPRASTCTGSSGRI